MVNLQLVSYIKENQKRGYKKEELIKILLENGWSREDVNSAYRFLEKNKFRLNPKNKKIIEEKEPLLNFVNSSLKKGISESQIRLALSVKGWKKEKVDSVFKKAKFPVINQGKEENPQEKLIQKMDISSVIKHTSFFFIGAFILFGTFLVGVYVQGMSTYTITDLEGQEQTKVCLTENCIDMKEHALDYVYGNYLVYFLLSLGMALIMVFAYAFLPFKHNLLWGYNLVYFLILVSIFYKWIIFQIN